MNKCYICGHEVIWDSDFDTEDYGYERQGIVHEYHCPECGADITVVEYIEGEADEMS